MPSLNALPLAAAAGNTVLSEARRTRSGPGKAGEALTMNPRRAVLEQLETLARAELQDMRSTHRGNADAPVADDSLVWLGLAWDMGLTGSNIAEVELPE
ncbi:hypothetical protein [Pseudoxanthomonas sp.]|uniref:hypothetical protein n=1 Tax=Pseudoxanthomonas sp. TaxID=1871049 RepID=UPI00261F1A32|nr:hypothetical protein [Pseudoxanthomonas sp.]WDS36864.1 MAG: hypothetical protein O8I58_02855 [Pseudoxanthomonas sp.]